MSLNQPVLAIDELPLGPARAVIAIVQGPAHGRRLVVAIRSTRTDQAIFFSSAPISRESDDSAGLLDTAVCFAESMGFLFDDDLEPADAARLWADWVAKAASPPRIASPQGAQRAEGERSRSASPAASGKVEGRAVSRRAPKAEGRGRRQTGPRKEGERRRSASPGARAVIGRLERRAVSPQARRAPSEVAAIPLTKFRLRPGRASIGGRLDPLGIEPDEKERGCARLT
ncbi:MAG: hypothetical protein V3T07_08680 [Myxococcota bacterium]